jgi:hypothetical protein
MNYRVAILVEDKQTERRPHNVFTKTVQAETPQDAIFETRRRAYRAGFGFIQTIHVEECK